ELDELPPRINQLEAQIRELELRMEREQEVLDGALEEMGRLEPRLGELLAERTRMQQALQENRGRLILLRSEARALWADLRRGSDGTDWFGRRQRLSAERQRHEEDAREAAEVLERDREALDAMTPHRSAVIEAVSEASAAHAALEGGARSLARRVEALRASLARCDQRLQARQQALADLDREASEVQERDHTSNAELTAARDELAALQAEMEPAEG